MPFRLNPVTGDLDLVLGGPASGDVVGPASSTDNAIARWDGATGKLLQDSVVLVDDVGVITGATQFNVDNLRLDGNTISSTDANGNIILTPNGAGSIVATPVTGIMASNGASGITGRTLTQPVAGITISNSDGTSGNPTFALANDLAALEGIGTTGFSVRTGADSWTTRILQAGSTKISISSGDGIFANPMIDAVEANFTLNNIGGTLSVSKGGTGANTLTDHGVLIGSGTGAITPVGPVSATGAVLMSNGVGSDPGFSTATYPLTSTINEILFSSATNTITGLATANRAVLTTGATGIPVLTAIAADGELIIGSTAGVPAAATLTQPAAGISITPGSNSITFALANDLAAVEALATTGLATRTASETWTTRTITGTANQIDVSNGDGVAGNPTLSLPTNIYVSGISFDSGSNILSTYEEGTWTPTIIGTATPGTATYTSQDAWYQRIGNKVYFQGRINYNSGTGTGNLRISGLPFTVSTTNYGTPGSFNADSGLTIAAGVDQVNCSPVINTTQIAVVPWDFNTSLGAVAYDAAAIVQFSGFYTI